MRLSFIYSLLVTMSWAGPASAATLPGSPASGVAATALSAATVLGCTPAACAISEGNPLILPYIAIAGDVILLDPDGTVSDVVRFLNNILDTGAGTGLGNSILMFSKIDAGPDLSIGTDLGLPSSFTYSANAVTLSEAPDGVPTIYNGNGTIYSFYSDTPEPCALWY